MARNYQFEAFVQQEVESSRAPPAGVVKEDVVGLADFFAETEWRRTKRKRAANYMDSLRMRSDDDGIDRLNHNYTFMLFALFATVVSTRQYGGDPIACWVPAEFTVSYESYTDKVCWVSNAYDIPGKNIEIPEEEAKREKISYYQFIPMVLWIQAGLFYAPCVLWRLLARRSGISLRTVMELAQNNDTREQEENCTCAFCYLVEYLDKYLGIRHERRRGCWARIKRILVKRCFFVAGTAHGNYLAVIYLFIKLLYITNCIGQLFLLNVFLGTDYHMFGVHIMGNILYGRHWRTSIRFPRLTLCEFKIRSLGNINKHLVQCVLPINQFNERIFVMVWFWLVFVGTLTTINFLGWLVCFLNRSGQVTYIRNHLYTMEKLRFETEHQVFHFTHHYLRQDGVFITRLVGKRAGEIVAVEIVGGLWDRYIKEYILVLEDETASNSDWQTVDDDVIVSDHVMRYVTSAHQSIVIETGQLQSG